MRNEKRVRKVSIINLGCKVNKYEADSMRDKLFLAGYEVVEPEEVADVYIVNTCSVTNMAQKKSRQMLRRAKKRNPNAIVIAAGCYVNAEHDILKGEAFVDVVVSNNCKKDIVAVIEDCLSDGGKGDYYIEIGQTGEYEEMGVLAASRMDHQRAYIKIQDGCNQFCSYCIIPYTRGRVRSRRAANIREEIETLAKEGVKEFVLTGIHISSYGVDLGKKEMQYDERVAHQDVESREKEMEATDLGTLIRLISGIPEVKRIRLGSLEPRIITEDFLKGLRDNEKFCPHFHLSLQSACNDTLKRMNRKYTVEEFFEKCNMIRTYFDQPAITTDVIVGFPGETEKEFCVTLENLKKLSLYEIHVFKYSVRAGTVAEKLPEQVSENIKGERSDRLLQLTAQQKETYERMLAGYTDEVLVEEEWAGDKEAQCLRNVQNLTGKDRACGIQEMEKTDSSQKEKQESFLPERMYFVGHTKRYVKVKIAADRNMINEVVKIQYI